VTPNLVTVPLGPGRKIELFNGWGDVDLIADLAGYYDTTGLKFFSVTPERVFDSRISPDGPWGEQQGWGLATHEVLPVGAAAIVANLTGTEPTKGTFVSAFAFEEPELPTVSNLNLAPGQTAPNLITVGLGPSRDLALFNGWGSVHLILDLFGYFAPAAA
jgi:hypothetical protein